jgi:uncharacterized membrane protein
MKILFKLIAVPFMLALTIIVPVLTFLFCYAATFLEIVSGIGVLISVIMLFAGERFDGYVILALSFLISPLGIPAIAEWLIDRLNGLNYLLRDYITG